MVADYTESVKTPQVALEIGRLLLETYTTIKAATLDTVGAKARMTAVHLTPQGQGHIRSITYE